MVVPMPAAPFVFAEEAVRPLNPSLAPRPAATGTVNSNFQRDARFYVDTVEATHPIFRFTGMLDSNYNRIRDEFLAYASRAANQTEFALEIQRFARVLQDGHMSWSSRNLFGDSYIHVNWVFRGSGLYMVDNSGDIISRVTEIGGVAVSAILDIIDTFFFFENETDRSSATEIMARNREIHTRAGVAAGNSVVLTVMEGNGTREITSSYQTGWQMTVQTRPNHIIRHEMMGDVFYIDLRQMQYDQPAHRQTVTAIQNAVSRGTKNFILDLRDNGGGNDLVGRELFQAMGISVPRMGVYRRISPLARAQRPDHIAMFPGVANGELRQQIAPNIAIAANPNNVTVAVLTNNATYSSATNVALLAQDGGFGVIIGEPSTNSPSAFGDMLSFTLPNTGLNLRVSYSRFMRPDTAADQTTLVPDIAVPSAQALTAARTFFRERGTAGTVSAAAERARAGRANAIAAIAREAMTAAIAANAPHFNAIKAAESVIRGHLGVDFTIVTDEVFSMNIGERVFTWSFLDLGGHRLDISQFHTLNAANAELGNIYNTQLGDVIIVNDGLGIRLLIDIDSGTAVGWSENHRLYRTFTLN
jgi:C-terminal processing protease CtpA/Prc